MKHAGGPSSGAKHRLLTWNRHEYLKGFRRPFGRRWSPGRRTRCHACLTPTGRCRCRCSRPFPRAACRPRRYRYTDRPVARRQPWARSQRRDPWPPDRRRSLPARSPSAASRSGRSLRGNPRPDQAGMAAPVRLAALVPSVVIGLPLDDGQLPGDHIRGAVVLPRRVDEDHQSALLIRERDGEVLLEPVWWRSRHGCRQRHQEQRGADHRRGHHPPLLRGDWRGSGRHRRGYRRTSSHRSLPSQRPATTARSWAERLPGMAQPR